MDSTMELQLSKVVKAVGRRQKTKMVLDKIKGMLRKRTYYIK